MQANTLLTRRSTRTTGSFVRSATSSMRSDLLLAIDACAPIPSRPLDMLRPPIAPDGARLSRKATTQVKATCVAVPLLPRPDDALARSAPRLVPKEDRGKRSRNRGLREGGTRALRTRSWGVQRDSWGVKR